MEKPHPIDTPVPIEHFLDQADAIRHLLIMEKQELLLRTLDTKALIKLRDGIHQELATRGSFR